MLRPRTRWELLQVDEDQVNRLAKESGVHPLVARLCWLRGIETPEEIHHFIQIDSQSFHDPFLLKGMEESCTRIRRAIDEKEPILIYGDYDADGVSSTSLMFYLMKHLDATFATYIPDRFSEGYGLNEEAILRASKEGYGLIITVDTGISAVQEVLMAKELGIDIIITDHHEPPKVLPDAYAIINPKQPDCTYPDPYLAGAGVALKLAQALVGEVPEEWIGIATLGTIADLVPLKGENRLITHRGLKALTHSQMVGIRALIKECGIEGVPLEAHHVGFMMGPRINAGGRLERADIGVQLLTATDADEAITLAKRLTQLNRLRQEMVQEIMVDADFQAEEALQRGEHVLVIGGESWNEGVIGIVASRLVEKYYRPTLVLSLNREEGVAKGSARSIEGFDLYQNLSKCEHLLLKFGGHTMAAGLSLQIDQIESVREELNLLASQLLGPEDYIPKTRIDLECRLEEINLPLLEQMSRLAPFGVDNPEPLITIKNVSIASMKKVGKEGDHLKWLFQQEEEKLDGIGFQWGEVVELISPHAKIDLVGELGVNEWNGLRKPQIFVRDLQVPHLQIFDQRGIVNRIRAIEEVPRKTKTAILYFRPENRIPLEAYGTDSDYCLLPVSRTGEPLGSLSNKEMEQIKQVIVYDIAETSESLKVFQLLSNLERLWCVFGVELNDRRLNRIPSREEFKWIYGYLFKHKRVTLNSTFIQLGRRQGIQEGELRFILHVFLDLGFISKQEDVYQLVDNPNKKDFIESPTYRMAMERLKIEDEWVFSPIQVISEWIIEMIKSREELKEAFIS